jgi:hypothetical protein
MKLWIKIFISGAILTVLALVYVYVFIYNKPHQDYEKAKPDFIITAEELFYSFVDNQAEAESKFNGKVLLLTGTVSSVEQTQDMTIVNFSFTEGIFGNEGIRCTMLDNHAEKANQLLFGTQISVKGLCTGFSGSDVIMEFCSLQ